MTKQAKRSSQRTTKTDDISARIKEAMGDKDWGQVSILLDESDKEDAEALGPIIGDLMTHHAWVVRASAVEVAGVLGLRHVLRSVERCLKDRNGIVRSYALMAYYDLLGARALPAISESAAAKAVRDRVTALALQYVETGDEEAFEKLSRILKRKGCDFRHRSCALNILDYYLDVPMDSRIIHLYEAILPDVPKSLGLARDIRRRLAGWKRAGRGQ